MNQKIVILYIIFLIFLQLTHFIDGIGTPTVDIYVKSIKYTVNPDYLKMGKCMVKTSRKIPTGLVICGGHLLQPLTYGFFQVTLFYKYGTIYREYLINYRRIEICEFMKNERNNKYSNILVDLARNWINKCCPLFDHECPFLPGWYNSSTIDINGTVTPLLPPVVPSGQYKVIGRLYLDNNLTIAYGEGSAIVKPNFANRAGEFTMLGMG